MPSPAGWRCSRCRPTAGRWLRCRTSCRCRAAPWSADAMRRLLYTLGAVAALALLAVAAAVALNLRGEDPLPATAAAPFVPGPGQVERGSYLALAGNCAGCHTARGGAAYAGGGGIETPL